MKRIAFLLICFACVAAGFATKAALDNETIARFFHEYAIWIAVAATTGLMSLGVMLLLGYHYVQHRLRKLLKADSRLTEAEIATGLVDVFTTPEGVSNPTAADRQRAALINAGTWFIRRQAAQFYFNVTVTVLGGLVGTATLFLLYEQNQKIDLQNEKITLQTDANITESVLLEGTRRAALSGDMSNLFEAIRRAHYDDQGVRIERECLTRGPFESCWQNTGFGTALFHLPPDLKSRVSSFAQRNTPYRIAVAAQGDLDFDAGLRTQVDFPNLSPERGQLFETLAANRIYVGDFALNQAQLAGVDLRGQNLTGARLSRANIEEAVLSYGVLNDVELDGALASRIKLNDATLDAAQFIFATLQGADFGRATARQADFRKADLSGSTFQSANLSDALFRGATLSGVSFRDANLTNADLRGASMIGDNWVKVIADGVPIRTGDFTIDGERDIDQYWPLIDATLEQDVFGSVNRQALRAAPDYRGANISGALFDRAKVSSGTITDVWAWRDMPPRDLPDGTDLTLCDFDPETHSRNTRPASC